MSGHFSKVSDEPWTALPKASMGTAYQGLADDLRRQILSGELKPGDRLPNEPELSAKYGVSRSTSREALRVLSSENLVLTARGVRGGSFVVHPNAQQIGDYLHSALGLLSLTKTIQVKDLLEVRHLLEVPAAGLAALRATRDDLAALRETLVDPDTTPNDVIHQANVHFHLQILNASKNPLLEIVAGPVFAVLERNFAGPHDWLAVFRDHLTIFEAVERRHEEAARSAASDHLDRLRGSYEAR